MFCQQCGKEIEQNVMYCPYCGGVNNNQVQTPNQNYTYSPFQCPKCQSNNVSVEKEPSGLTFLGGFLVWGIIALWLEGTEWSVLSDFLYFGAGLSLIAGIWKIIKKIFSSKEVWECECLNCHERYNVRR